LKDLGAWLVEGWKGSEVVSAAEFLTSYFPGLLTQLHMINPKLYLWSAIALIILCFPFPIFGIALGTRFIIYLHLSYPFCVCLRGCSFLYHIANSPQTGPPQPSTILIQLLEHKAMELRVAPFIDANVFHHPCFAYC
jgi:hypothetical protein